MSRFWGRESEGGAISLDRITEDNHSPVFPAHVVELDLEWRVRKSQGLSYGEVLAEFELQRDRSFSQAIQKRNVNLSPRSESRLRAPNIPEGRWGI